MEKYTHQYTVVCTDMNKDYRLTPAAVLLYFQESFARYMACLHLAAFDLIKERKMWIITEMSAEMMPVDTFWGDDIEVVLWISELTPLRVYSDYFVRNISTGEVIAKGTSCWNLMNADTRKLETTESVALKITVVPEMMVERHKKMRFPKGEIVLKQVGHKVNLLDLDFNGHVNNRSYLSIAMLTATDEFLAANRTTRFAIHWIHESYLGENLLCTLMKVADNTYLHQLTKEDGTVTAEIFSSWQPYDHQVDVAEVAQRN